MQAARAGRPLWISYVNADGVASQRMVEPMEVSGGLLDAFDHLRGARRTFAVHRIAAVGTVGWDDDEVDRPGPHRPDRPAAANDANREGHQWATDR